jgi:putative acetyltransferase
LEERRRLDELLWLLHIDVVPTPVAVFRNQPSGVNSSDTVPLDFLEGDPGYYSRFGFAPCGSQNFRKPSLCIPDDGFQAVRLPGYEPWMTGTLVCAEPFWRYDVVGLRDPNA